MGEQIGFLSLAITMITLLLIKTLYDRIDTLTTRVDYLEDLLDRTRESLLNHIEEEN